MGLFARRRLLAFSGVCNLACACRISQTAAEDADCRSGGVRKIQQKSNEDRYRFAVTGLFDIAEILRCAVTQKIVVPNQSARFLLPPIRQFRGNLSLQKSRGNRGKSPQQIASTASAQAQRIQPCNARPSTTCTTNLVRPAPAIRADRTIFGAAGNRCILGAVASRRRFPWAHAGIRRPANA